MENLLFKFEQLEVWQISLDLNDLVYDIIALLPEDEKFNLISQLRRAGTSISLNIAEGSTGTSNKEQSNYLKIALRSCIEVVACLKLIIRRKYLVEKNEVIMNLFQVLHKLFAKLNAFIKAINQ
ncbi:MAG: four helix bundle protein [Candidatus Cyclobacteriaceae bacterium M3_2C_046]